MKITLNGLCDNAIRNFGQSQSISTAERLLLRSYMPLVIAVEQAATSALCNIEAIRFKLNNFGDKNPPVYLPLMVFLKQGNTRQTVMLEMQDDGASIHTSLRNMGDHAKLIRVPPTCSSEYQFAAKYRAAMRAEWRQVNRLQAMLDLTKYGIYATTPESKERMDRYIFLQRSLVSDNAKIKRGTVVRWLHPITQVEQIATFGGFGRRQCVESQDYVNCFWLITSANREVVFYEKLQTGEPVPLHLFEILDKHIGDVEEVVITADITELPMAHLPLVKDQRVRMRSQNSDDQNWYKGTLRKLTEGGKVRIDLDNGLRLTVGLTTTQIQRIVPVQPTNK